MNGVIYKVYHKNNQVSFYDNERLLTTTKNPWVSAVLTNSLVKDSNTFVVYSKYSV